MLRFGELIEIVGDENWSGDPHQNVQGIQYDSRKVVPGDVFVAVPGFHTDGHHYLVQAVEKGAAAVVVEDSSLVPTGVSWVMVEDSRLALSRLASYWFEHPSRKMRVIGVTGTNGKTTTTFLIERVLAAAGNRVGLMGTVENRINGTPQKTSFTTPDSVELQGLLAKMAAEEIRYVVMEVSSHALKLKRVADCEFDVGVFTNLTQDHMDFHESVEDYFESKAVLFKSLANGSKSAPKYAVVNVDDPYGAFLETHSKVPTFTYGINNFKADVRAHNVRTNIHGTFFEIQAHEIDMDIDLQLIGRFNVYNALAAFCVGLKERFPPEKIKSALESCTGIPGRFESISEGQDYAVVVDYAHTPDGLANVLQTAREISTGRVLTVFGCGGDRDRTKRPIMGEVVAKYSDFCVVTSDNPRSEPPAAIIEDILPGVQKFTENFEVIENRREAIRRAVKLAVPGDIVIIAGKGHETYQIVGGRTLHFDDREEAREALGVRKND